MSELPEYAIRNRATWDVWARDYEEPGRRHWAQDEPSWGVWGVPESQLHILPGELAGLDVIELGWGSEAACWERWVVGVVVANRAR